VNKTKITERFNPEKYGMVFCPDCSGSGKSFLDSKGDNVCKVCGGFGLIRKQQKGLLLDKRFPVVLLR
jgi:hypothetical protein